VFSSLLITLREGLEAALILAVVISFLKRADGDHLTRYVWYGVAAAAVVSIAAGGALFALGGSLSDEAGEIFEIAATFSAAALLTYVILWMRKNGRNLKAGLEDRTRTASTASPLALAVLSFAAVGREGLETALFLFASASSATPAATLLGGITGLTIATAAGIALYRGTVNLNLKVFFGVTGVLLILFAAGLLSYAIHELEELGYVTGALAEPVWDTSPVLSHEGGAGAMLKAMFGYRANPSLLQVIVYWSYLAAMSWLYFRPQPDRLREVGQGNARA
jgi:high-affinity iron transporter